jgi:predicted permease
VLLNADVSTRSIESRLQSVWNAVQRERVKSFISWPQGRREKYLEQKVMLERASGGISEMRETFRVGLLTVSVIVILVLLIACANVANLLAAEATARAKEMALRICVGAGRFRLIQLMLVQSAIITFAATAMGSLFAWWAAPFILSRVNPPDNPARLALPADWRVLGFVTLLCVLVVVLFGLLPALRASSVRPALTLKGAANPTSHHRLMHGLIAVQVAFCFVVLFAAGAFTRTFSRLASQPLGFSEDRVITLQTVAQPQQSIEHWYQAADQLRTVSGIESVALAAWPLLSGIGQNGFVSVNGAPSHPLLAYFLRVSPGWINTMKVPLIDGRDLRPNETPSGVALVNEAFAKEYFDGRNPVGRAFDAGKSHYEVVGLVKNARYRNLREPLTPTAYIPLGPASQMLKDATLIVRTSSGSSMAIGSLLRRSISSINPSFRVSNIRTQSEIDRDQTLRERLLAVLSSFFGSVALLLAGIGLYGVLDYSVLQRRKEFGIRMAIGAPERHIARLVTAGVFSMLVVGTAAGLAISVALEPYVRTLLFQVRGIDSTVILPPLLTVGAAGLVAALPAILQVHRIDPTQML